ncbi:MAG TPA: glycosyltransferase family 4 protein [Bryobacteraceae bacterium]|jgi:glycosyltransferase involved in cell wall biosynthesis|nr:glycosyltransferase family 4 protein [Bryobacteraceae bacterium]
MKLAVVVQGRFHAFDLVRALIARGNDVTVFSNYPRWAMARFGIPRDRVCSFPLHGVLARVAGWVREKTGISFEPVLHPMFSRWAARKLRRESWDIIHTWTGVAEEIDSDPALQSAVRFVMRGSAHIRSQAELLAGEQLRTGCAVDHPSEWMIAREQREYALADYVMVLSTFAYKSFLERGIAESKLLLLPLGTQTDAFRPAMDVVQARRSRILSGSPLRVLYVGGISWRKGLFDLREILTKAAGRFEFRFVGPVWPEAREAVSGLGHLAEFISKKPQGELPAEYAWGDVFIFPTIEDGYAVVLAQASAAALPILTTTNCCGPDLIVEGETGWVLPIRNPEAFLERLDWCDSHRPELAGMVAAAYERFRTRDWFDVAADFESLCRSDIRTVAGKGSHVSISR